MRRLAFTSGTVLAALFVAATGFWAGRVALAPPPDPLLERPGPVTYEVVEQTLGESLQFAAVAQWNTTPLVRGWGSGIVTSVDFAAGDEVGVGDVLFTVDLRPVVVARGAVPAFRDLRAGDAGLDVKQLESMLADIGLLIGDPDEHFDAATTGAVRAWQESLGVAPDGTVHLGDVLFAPELPVRVVATDALQVGALLPLGEVVVNRLSREPVIVVPLTPDQRNLVPLTGTVRLTYPEGTWQAVVARASENSDGGVDRLDLELEAPDGGPVCGAECPRWIPATGKTDFPAEIVIIPETKGPTVPVAAIATDPGGGQTVQLADGRRMPIEVIVSTDGLAIVEGIGVGDLVVLPLESVDQ